MYNDDINPPNDSTPGTNRDGQITFKIAAGGTGTYTLGVGETGNNAIGSYTLTVSAGYADGIGPNKAMIIPRGALGRLGFEGISDVRQGKRFELTVDGAVTAIDSYSAALAKPAAESPSRCHCALSSVSTDLEKTAYFFRSVSSGSTSSDLER